MADKLKEKSKSFFGILVMVVAGGLGYFVAKEVKDQWFLSESIEKAAKSGAAETEKDLKSAQSQATKEKPATTILAEKAYKDTTSTLNSASTEEQKLKSAAQGFIGAYLINIRNRPDYCASLGIPIKSFVSSYKQKHQQLFTITERILIQDLADHGHTYDIDMFDKLLSPSAEKLIAQVMKDTASILEVSEQELCQAFEQNSIEWADVFDFRKQMPEIANILLTAE